MPSVEVTVDPDRSLMELKVSGVVTADIVVDAVHRHFPARPMRLVLWDFSGAQLDALVGDGLWRIAQASNQYAAVRKSGKTAFVAQGPVAEKAMTLYESFTMPFAGAIRYALFAHRSQALDWLGAD